MEDSRIQRGLMLFEQGRYEMASKEFGAYLAEDPNESFVLSLMAMCLSEMEQFNEAQTKAAEAIREAPDSDFAHYAMAAIMMDRRKLNPAKQSIEQAINLDPEVPKYHAILGQIHYSQSHWKEALESAEQGLAIDPEDDGCVNLRAMALTKLGRKEEADQTIQSALARDPENSYSHANFGWQHLENGNTDKSLTHFQEALRIDPSNEWARDGIIHALKSRYFIYGLFLKYLFFMARLTPGVQMGVVIGGWFVIRALRSHGEANPEHQVWITPIVILYMTFALLTWTADSLFNLALRMNKIGCMALPEKEFKESNIMAAFLFPGLIFLGLGIADIFEGNLLICALICGLMLIPLSATFHSQAGWPRKAMSWFSGIMGTMGVALIAFILLGYNEGEKIAGAFMVMAILAPWVGNFAMMMRPTR